MTLGAFVTSAVVGGVMAVAMVAWSGEYARHWAMFQTIGHEILTVRNPAKLSEIAAARKPTMTAAALRHPDRGRFDRVLRVGGSDELS